MLLAKLANANIVAFPPYFSLCHQFEPRSQSGALDYPETCRDRFMAKFGFFGESVIGFLLKIAAIATCVAAVEHTALAETPAKVLFGSKSLPADLSSQAVGFYSKGCLAGGTAIPVDGPAWQVMRLSRNRRWGHPDLIATLEELSVNAKKAGWNGLMIGDMSQPRGGPMLTGHTSHQVGLDADIWFTPMPDKRLNFQEREELSAVSVLKANSIYVDDARWTPVFTNLLHEAAEFPQVQRIFVHPGIKKKLCDTVKGDRAWLAKIRPYYGHHYHFHLRIFCPEGSPGCKPQKEVGSDIGCGNVLDWWFKVALAPKKAAKPKKPEKKPVKPRQITLAALPKACTNVLNANEIAGDKAEYNIQEVSFSAPKIEIPRIDPAAILASKPIEASKSANSVHELEIPIPIPTPRPNR